MNDAGKIAFTPKGDYDSTATYEYLDTVVYNGNAYAALKTTTGNQPEDNSEYWALLARGGALVPSATKNTQGVVKLSDSSAVTDSTGLALPVTEKNASIEGSLANQIAGIKRLDLLWSNSNSGNSPVGLRIPASDKYDIFLIYSTGGTVTSIGNWVNCTSYIRQFLNIYSVNAHSTCIAYRKVSIVEVAKSDATAGKAITFDSAYYKSVLENSERVLSDGNCIPLRVYGIRK